MLLELAFVTLPPTELSRTRFVRIKMETTTRPALLDRISTALQSSPYVPEGLVRVETAADGNVVLEGHVGSFFQKQMAQEAVRRIDGVELVVNHLQVSWA